MEVEIKQRKQRKFQRDREDYQTGHILTFARKYEAPRREHFKANKSIVSDTEVSSAPDVSKDEHTARESMSRRR